jgi:hypothetical protein
MPRLDLHRHLEGSHSPDALVAVATERDIRDPIFYSAELHRFRTADELRTSLVLQTPSDDASAFYACITHARAAYVDEDAIEALAVRAFVEAAGETDGFEMRASLFSMTRTLLEHERANWREVPPVVFAERARAVLRRVLAARDAAHARTHKPMLVRIGFSRTFESEPHYRAMAAMLVEHKLEVCGLDVLGIVSGPDREPMPPALRDILLAVRRDIPDLTIHAGEFDGHTSVQRTLELDPQAIGHGVRSVESDDVMRTLADRGVTLEVCPTSNRLLIPTVLAQLEARNGCAPLVALQRAHVCCVLGSDDPTPMGTSFDREWAIARELGVDLDRLERDTARRWAQIVGR